MVGTDPADFQGPPHAAVGLKAPPLSISALRAVLFDLDGTLVDSAEDLREALNEVLAREGLRAIEAPEVPPMVGDGALKLVERGLARAGGDPARARELLPRFLSAYEPRAACKTRPYPGVVETLRALRARGPRLGVVTNKPEVASRAILDALGLAPFLEVVIGGDTLTQRKPSPEPVIAALRELGVEPRSAVMVGDNRHDVEAARAAGVKTVLVSYGYAHGAPHALGADRVIDGFPDLLSTLPDLGFALGGPD
jgi:phosphoglycolate phosphatase